MRSSSSRFKLAERGLLATLAALLSTCATTPHASVDHPLAWCNQSFPAGATISPLPTYEPIATAKAQPAGLHPRWLVVWATWCKPCLDELPRLQAALDQVRAHGLHPDLTLLSIDADGQRLASFVNQDPRAFATVRVLRATSAEDFDAWAKRVGLDSSSVALPVHLLATADGTVSCVHSGALLAEDIDVPGKLLR